MTWPLPSQRPSAGAGTAASWLPTLSRADSAADIRPNVDYLATGMGDGAEHQRSVRVVFAAS